MGQVPTLSHPLIPHTLGISWGQWWERYATTSEHKHEAEDCLTRAFMTTFGAAVAQVRTVELVYAVRDPVRENLNSKGFEKKTWTPPRFLHRGPKKAVEHDSDIHFDLT